MTVQSPYVIYNGEMMKSTDVHLSVTNRSFLYGDSIFETMHFCNGTILFLNDHLERLKKGLKYLSLKKPSNFTETRYRHQVEELVKKNQVTGRVRIRLTVFRNEGGFYIPESSDSSYIITVIPLHQNNFVLNPAGLRISICKTVVLPVGNTGQNKTGNCIPYIRAGIFAKIKGYDDCLLLNANGKIAEAVSSNVFIISSGNVITPPLYDGCVAGVFRKNLIRILRKEKIIVLERSLEPEDIRKADELFLTNVMQGIRLVREFEGIRMKSEWVKKISGLVMEDLFQD